jgi:hypothetical protein
VKKELEAQQNLERINRDKQLPLSGNMGRYTGGKRDNKRNNNNNKKLNKR